MGDTQSWPQRRLVRGVEQGKAHRRHAEEHVTCSRASKSRASRASKRAMSEIEAPAATDILRTAHWPNTWASGAAPRTTSDSSTSSAVPRARDVLSNATWLSSTPFDALIVPEVYSTTAVASGSTDRAAAAVAVDHEPAVMVRIPRLASSGFRASVVDEHRGRRVAKSSGDLLALQERVEGNHGRPDTEGFVVASANERSFERSNATRLRG